MHSDKTAGGTEVRRLLQGALRTQPTIKAGSDSYSQDSCLKEASKTSLKEVMDWDTCEIIPQWCQ